MNNSGIIDVRAFIQKYSCILGGKRMRTYVLTAFEQSGEKLMDKSFTATNDDEAKEKGELMLAEKGYSNHTHRCVSPEAKLLLFHS